MNYNELFSQVVHRSKASAIRELLKVIARPDIISIYIVQFLGLNLSPGRSASARRKK